MVLVLDVERLLLQFSLNIIFTETQRDPFFSWFIFQLAAFKLIMTHAMFICQSLQCKHDVSVLHLQLRSQKKKP